MMIRFLLPVFLFCLSGCAVDIQRGIVQDFKSEGSSQIVIIRKYSYVGYGYLVQLLVDGELAAGLRVGDYFKLSVAPGRHIISARSYHGVIRDFPVSIEAGKTQNYVFSISFIGEFVFNQIDAKEAIAMINKDPAANATGRPLMDETYKDIANP
jgi:hypothetical protein